MVSAVRRGQSIRSVARRLGVSHNTVRLWLARAREHRLDRVSFDDRAAGCPSASNRTPKKLERQVLCLRKSLKERSDLGDFGAAAIHRVLLERHAGEESPVPAVRTIGRILERHGALDGRRRVRRPPPPRGWYLPALAAHQAELDSFDTVTDLVIVGGIDVTVLNAISLHGALCQSWPLPRITAKIAVESLLSHWRAQGLPGYAKFDNDTVFQGAHQWPDSFGRVTRLCLSLGVTPVFAPPRETGFQAEMEAFNGRWQRNVWRRFQHRSLSGLSRRSERYVRAARERDAQRIDAAPARQPFPVGFALDLSVPLRGRVIFLRRADASGQVQFLGHSWKVDRQRPHRLVRAEVDLTQGAVNFFGLRRREPTDQPLLRQTKYAPPRKRFCE